MRSLWFSQMMKLKIEVMTMVRTMYRIAVLYDSEFLRIPSTETSVVPLPPVESDDSPKFIE